MSIDILISKYIKSAEEVFKKIEIKKEATLTKEKINNVIKYARDYLNDAKYYKLKKKLETSLTSIAYCEGLLDALKLLEVVSFDWLAKEESKK